MRQNGNEQEKENGNDQKFLSHFLFTAEKNWEKEMITAKRFSPKAQGCDEGATLGNKRDYRTNKKSKTSNTKITIAAAMRMKFVLDFLISTLVVPVAVSKVLLIL